MEKKLRIQLFNEDGNLINDRLLSQDTEMYSGPKENHEGPMRIEFTLENKDDIEKAKTYLDKLVGNLPLNSSKKKGKIKKVFNVDTREKVLEEALRIGEESNQDSMIEYLRDMSFNFMMSDFIKTFDFPMLKIKERHFEKYQWMVHCIKKAKNPKSDKYDPMLIFGISMANERSDKIVVYLNGEFNGYHTIKVPDKNRLDFKKTNMIKFPHYMIEEEREKFRYELRQYQDNPDKPLSKFFNRWVGSVSNLPELNQLKGD